MLPLRSPLRGFPLSSVTQLSTHPQQSPSEAILWVGEISDLEETKHKVRGTDVGNRAGIIPRSGSPSGTEAGWAQLTPHFCCSGRCLLSYETSYFNGGSEKSF